MAGAARAQAPKAQDANWTVAHPDDGETNDDGAPNALASVQGIDLVEIWNKASNIEKEIGTEIVADLQFVVAPPRREAQRETGPAPALRVPDESDAIADPGLRRVYRNSRQRLA